MKKLLFTLLLLTGLQVAFSQSSKIQKVEIQTEITCDHCMECGSCGENIFTHIKKNTKGVKSIKINPELSVINVKFDSEKTTLEEIENAIALSGYKANDKMPTDAAYGSLDGCCKR